MDICTDFQGNAREIVDAFSIITLDNGLYDLYNCDE
jgi:hypothetical protein